MISSDTKRTYVAYVCSKCNLNGFVVKTPLRLAEPLRQGCLFSAKLIPRLFLSAALPLLMYYVVDLGKFKGSVITRNSRYAARICRPVMV